MLIMIFSESYELYYEPKIESSTGRLLGVECHPRYKVDDGVTLSSNFFIRNVYSTNKNYEMFLFTLKESTKHLRDIQTPLRIYVSVKVEDIICYDLAKAIRVQCAKSGVAINSIFLELDDISIKDGDEELFVKLDRLINIGVNILVKGEKYKSFIRYSSRLSKLKIKFNVILDSIKKIS
ncbi:EAL domain-containing protein [Vibrio chagasii]|nr:EAL domain-containing protein [Vibrio chagasii]CAH7014192.1 EAL domain-containing protein [Vibrio chagasii]CAH7060496.1 EAL domain-containing protein [Vibrio chagasii]